MLEAMKSETFKTLAAAAALGAIFSGCAKPPEDPARRAQLLKELTAASSATCDRGPVNSDQASYEMRLHSVLKDVSIPALEILREHKVTICLDQRLPSQKIKLLGAYVEGIYYNDQNQSGVAAISDSGQPHYSGRFVPAFGAPQLQVIAGALSHGEIKAADKYWIAYKAICGEGCYDVEISRATGFAPDNPALETPPVLKPAPRQNLSLVKSGV